MIALCCPSSNNWQLMSNYMLVLFCLFCFVLQKHFWRSTSSCKDTLNRSWYNYRWTKSPPIMILCWFIRSSTLNLSPKRIRCEWLQFQLAIPDPFLSYFLICLPFKMYRVKKNNEFRLLAVLCYIDFGLQTNYFKCRGFELCLLKNIFCLFVLFEK